MGCVVIIEYLAIVKFTMEIGNNRYLIKFK
jgi:hypothetical protein